MQAVGSIRWLDDCIAAERGNIAWLERRIVEAKERIAAFESRRQELVARALVSSEAEKRPA
jgi:hypothetical protein